MNNKKPNTVPQKNIGKSAVKQAPKVPAVWRAEDYVTPSVSLDQVYSVKQAFDIFDVDKSGLIDAVQLKNAFCSLGFSAQNKFVYRILHDHQTENPLGLNFAQFLKLSTGKLNETPIRAQIQRVFNSFDVNKAGKISAAELKKVAQQLNENLTDQQIQKMILKADSDEDGLLTVEDFYTVLTSMNNNSFQ